MSELVSIQWFPGHMAKTRRQMKESLTLIDCVAEIVDARIPYSSRNPEFNELFTEKPRMILLNKCDLADPEATKKWVQKLEAEGIKTLPVDCKSGRGINKFLPVIRELLKDKLEKYAQKGMAGRKIRIMVAGVPNCGKSTFINRMAGSNRLKAEDRPGVTRSRAWIDLGSGFELMDTPGMLWPKFEDPAIGEKLAFCGAVKDDVIDTELLSRRLLEVIAASYPDSLRARYKLSGELPAEGDKLLSLIGRKRGMLISGGEVDTERASIIVLDEFRSGKLGKITLEMPEG